MEINEPILRTIYLSLGSNIGSKIDNIRKTIQLMIDADVISNPILSSFYESAPYGYLNQDSFVNIAIKAHTNHSLFELLFLLKSTEYLIGRVKREKWHEREIDIDIVFYDNLIFDNHYITIPHKEFNLRNFVLAPLNEIAPDFIDPKSHKNLKQLLNESSDHSIVKKIKID